VPFGKLVWAEAVRRELPEAVASVVIADGGVWIWNLASEHFSTSRQGVDWYHAKQHLYTVEFLLFGEGTAEAQALVKQKAMPLYQGHARHLADELRALAQTHRRSAKTLRQEAGYFENNHRGMDFRLAVAWSRVASSSFAPGWSGLECIGSVRMPRGSCRYVP
jgi:hypothetical protein